MALKVWTLSRGYHYEGSGLVKIFDTLDKAKLAAEQIVEGDNDHGDWQRGSYDDTHTWENDAGWLTVSQWEVE